MENIDNKIDNTFNWDAWLTEKETLLKELGYRKYIQHYKNEDFIYWKTFEGYQVGVSFYDFRKYVSHTHPDSNRIGIQYECMFIDCDCRIDLSVSKDMQLIDFECMAKEFYVAMLPYSK
jgi:hypothetical protein